jgi:predicted AAA+ superfamily ATPase
MTIRQRVDAALTHLRDGLNPFVAAQMLAAYRNAWVAHAKQSVGDGGFRTDRSGSPIFDITALISLMLDQWREVFGRVLGRSEHRIVHRIRDARNDFAHQQEITLDRAIGVFEDIESLLNAVGAGDHAAAVRKLKEETGRERYGEAPKLLEAASEKDLDKKTLVAWRDVIVPHPDVRTRRFLNAEFAADLYDVAQRVQSGRSLVGDEYADPKEFFARTFITSGLSMLLRNAALRLSGGGGEPVVELQTSFGGGKTHALLALYHLASGRAFSELPGVGEMLKDDGISELPALRRVVLDGTRLAAGQPMDKADGTLVRTIWGELAYQLGGKEGYAMIAGADATSTNPGAALRDLLKRYSPCVILVDEWVAYARQLPQGETALCGGSFETQFTFAQALSQEVKATNGALLVFTLPMSEAREEASDIEVGGARGREALNQLRNAFGRIQANWQPADASESYAIVRRRLFEPLKETETKLRDRAVNALHRYYREKEHSFPKYASEPYYRERLEECYPLHPSLFESLYKEWGGLERFQRTRGVLRLMAAAIHALWAGGDTRPLIMPGTLPLEDPGVKSDLTRYLGNQNQWDSVLARDVLGTDSVAARIDSKVPQLGKHNAAQRVAKAIFLATAPAHAEGTGGKSTGIDMREIRLGCVFPGEQLAAFDDAVRRLKDEGTHVNSDDSTYWFGLPPNLNRRVAELAALYEQESHLVDEAIEERLRRWQRERSTFVRVHGPTTITSEIPDEPGARLAILGPQVSHRRKSESSEAANLATTMIAKFGESDRRYKNCLVFLAADAAKLDELRSAVRRALAWRDILGETSLQELTGAQRGEAERRRHDADAEVERLLKATWSHGIVPEQAPSVGAPIEFVEIRVEGGDSPVSAFARKLESEGRLATVLGGPNLRMELDGKNLWHDRGAIPLRELYEYFAQYPYLTRLKDESVLKHSVMSGIASLAWQAETFAYADGYNESKVSYVGLVAGSDVGHAQVDMVRGLLVKASVAAEQFARVAVAVTVPASGVDGGSAKPSSADSAGARAAAEAPQQAPPPRHYFQRVTLSNPTDLVKVAGQLGNDIVYLLTSKGARAEVTIEVAASLDSGIAPDLEERLRSNAAAHKFPDPELNP